jgi:hypothetical protein
MTDSLIPMDDLGVTAQKDDNFDSLVESRSYLQRVQLYGSNSKDVKKDLIQQGRFGIPRSKTQIDDIGKEFHCIPLGYRYKALDTSGDPIIQTYEAESDVFKEIKEKSFVQDSGCLFGIEFLIWMPEQKEFMVFYLSSKSARPEAKPLRNLISKAACIKSDLVEGKKYSWHVPVVTASDVAIKDLPNPDEMKAVLDKFNNPTSDEVADEVDDGR